MDKKTRKAVALSLRSAAAKLHAGGDPEEVKANILDRLEDAREALDDAAQAMEFTSPLLDDAAISALFKQLTGLRDSVVKAQGSLKSRR